MVSVPDAARSFWSAAYVDGVAANARQSRGLLAGNRQRGRCSGLLAWTCGTAAWFTRGIVLHAVFGARCTFTGLLLTHGDLADCWRGIGKEVDVAGFWLGLAAPLHGSRGGSCCTQFLERGARNRGRCTQIWGWIGAVHAVQPHGTRKSVMVHAEKWPRFGPENCVYW